MNDCIRLPRSALDLVRDKDLWQLYGYLLSKADENGEITTSLATIQRDLHVTQRSLRTMLAKLEATSKTTSKTTNKSTKITLCKTNSCALEATSKTTNKSTNKTTKRFTPPTDAEVADYVSEKGYHFNPEQFIPFYQSKGWKVGNQPMKDWKAACRTWEASWKEKYGEQFYYDIQPAGRVNSSLRSQDDRYSALAAAAGAVLRNSPRYNAT